jgi:type VI secretion system secreted protein Hcp
MAIVLQLQDALGNQIRGESTVPGHQGDIDVLEWSWGISAAAGTHLNLRNILIKKSVDLASPPLATRARSRDVLNGNLVILDGGGAAYLLLTLGGVTVNEIDIAGTGVPLQEAVTLGVTTVGLNYKNSESASLS